MVAERYEVGVKLSVGCQFGGGSAHLPRAGTLQEQPAVAVASSFVGQR